LAEDGNGEKQQCEQSEDANADRAAPPNSWSQRSWRPRGGVPRALVVAESQGTRRNILMTTMNRNYLEKPELGKR
jgi:hypothetical protein